MQPLEWIDDRTNEKLKKAENEIKKAVIELKLILKMKEKKGEKTFQIEYSYISGFNPFYTLLLDSGIVIHVDPQPWLLDAQKMRYRVSRARKGNEMQFIGTMTGKNLYRAIEHILQKTGAKDD